jgi:multidrug resistance efflux pump
LDRSDIDQQLAMIGTQISEFKRLMTIEGQRSQAEFNQLLMDHRRRTAEMEANVQSLKLKKQEASARSAAKETELAGVKNQINQVQKSIAAGLGGQADMAFLVTQRDTLEVQVRDANHLAESFSEQITLVEASLAQWKSEDVNQLMVPATSRYASEIESLHRTELELKQQAARREVTSGGNGRVVAVFCRPGDLLNSLQPILTIQEQTFSYVDAYMPDGFAGDLGGGSRVQIVSRRVGVTPAQGTVAFVDPGYVQLPPSLLGPANPLRGVVNARRVRIALDSPHSIMPGEIVLVKTTAQVVEQHASAEIKAPSGRVAESTRLADESALVATSGSAVPALVVPPAPVLPAIAADVPVAKPEGSKASTTLMSIPYELTKRSHFEPSGLVWLADLDRYVVISDDTGVEPAQRFAPWLYLMDRAGQVELQPVEIEGISEIADLESISAGPDGTLFVLSSQSLSAKGKRHESRTLLVQVERSGRTFKAKHSIPLLKAIVSAYNTEQLTALGLPAEQVAEPGTLVLDVEGSAWRDGSLYIGLKEPVSSKGAIIWRLDRVADLLAGKPLEAGQLSIWSTVDLGKGNGIADISFMVSGRMVVTSTRADESAGQLSRVALVGEPVSGVSAATILLDVPDVQIEGVTEIAPGHLTAVTDKGKKVPDLWDIPVEQR